MVMILKTSFSLVFLINCFERPGFAISADGEFIYFTPLASRSLYRVETSALRVNQADDKLAFIRAANSVQFLGEVRIK